MHFFKLSNNDMVMMIQLMSNFSKSEKILMGRIPKQRIPIWRILDGVKTPLSLSAIYILKDLWK